MSPMSAFILKNCAMYVDRYILQKPQCFHIIDNYLITISINWIKSDVKRDYVIPPFKFTENIFQMSKSRFFVQSLFLRCFTSFVPNNSFICGVFIVENINLFRSCHLLWNSLLQILLISRQVSLMTSLPMTCVFYDFSKHV